MEITVKKAAKAGTMPPEDQLGFGHYFTDHMFVMDFNPQDGWHNPRIEPYNEVSLYPSAMVLHYGQAIFEGIKAFKTEQGKIVVFRVEEYLNRFNRSADILCIPHIDVNLVKEGLFQLIDQDKAWVPGSKGTALYIRPVIVSTDPYVGVKVSDTYRLYIILSPVGAYYAAGFDPVKIKVEDHFVRATVGGLGEAKTPANYAASLRAGEVAKKEGFAQVLWLDAVEKKWIEEVGTMNILFKINDEIVTPSLDGSILGGITRKTVLELARSWGMKVVERKISIDEVFAAHKNGTLQEVFGSGTAAVISPVGQLTWKGETIIINQNKTGETAQKLFDYITGVQYGTVQDEFGWIAEVTKI